MVPYTVPGMKSDSGEKVAALLQDRLNSLNDLALTLKHVHWNVVGPNFIAVHTMLDPQVEAVRAMVEPKTSTWSLRTCSSGNRASWSSSTGSSALTWKHPTAR